MSSVKIFSGSGSIELAKKIEDPFKFSNKRYKDVMDKIKFVVECKSYIDSSMLKRAIIDFYEVKKVLGDCPRIISTGQLAIKEETLNYHRELAKELGVPFEVFVLNTSKWRKKNIGVTKTLDTLDENALNMLRGHLRNLI